MKQALCLSCKNYDLVVLFGGTKSGQVIQECYYPANNFKSGTARKCEEYEAKPEKIDEHKT